MKRITLVLGVVAVMVAMLVALAAPAMAKDNGGINNRVDNRVDNDLNSVDNDLGPLDNGLDNSADLNDGDLVDFPACFPFCEDAIVDPGDTLFGIAQEQLGPDAPAQLIPDQVDTIHNLNRDVIGDNPHMIFPGQHLRMPSHR